jgi:filamentous hemagglutinin
LNTRTSAALDRAGVPKTEWHGVDRTGQPVPGAEGTTFNDLADAQLKRNGLPPNGTPNTPQGKNK